MRSLIALLFLLPSLARAEHAWGGHLGLRLETLRDDALAPVAFSGSGLRFGSTYRGDVAGGLLAARLDLGARILVDRRSEPALSIDHRVGAAWLPTVVERGSYRLRLGPALSIDGSSDYLESWDDAHAYWIGAHFLGVAAQLTAALGSEWRLELQPELGLFGLVSRPPIYRFNKQDNLDSLDFHFTVPYRDLSFATPLDAQVLRVDVAVRAAPLSASDAVAGWAYGVDLRLRRAVNPAMAVQLSAVFYASRTWEL